MKYRIEYEHSVKDFEDVWYIEKDYLEPSTIASVDQVTKWDKKNSDIHIFVRDLEKDKIVGEITLLPLSEEQFIKFMNNILEDTEINEDTLVKYESNQNYYLLYSAMAIASGYRNDRMVLSLLLKGFYNKINNLKDRGIKFLNMCAEGQTSDGQKFAETFLNLKHKRNTKEGYKLYSFDDSKEFDEWVTKLPKYIESYNDRFNIKY
ncbi:MAG: hypothetical protein J6K23_03050 [Bacilli bacterium]|nr:hypothetical protein [Bacilli bacterium]